MAPFLSKKPTLDTNDTLPADAPAGPFTDWRSMLVNWAGSMIFVGVISPLLVWYFVYCMRARNRNGLKRSKAQRRAIGDEIKPVNGYLEAAMRPCEPDADDDRTRQHRPRAISKTKHLSRYMGFFSTSHSDDSPSRAHVQPSYDTSPMRCKGREIDRRRSARQPLYLPAWSWFGKDESKDDPVRIIDEALHQGQAPASGADMGCSDASTPRDIEGHGSYATICSHDSHKTVEPMTVRRRTMGTMQTNQWTVLNHELRHSADIQMLAEEEPPEPSMLNANPRMPYKNVESDASSVSTHTEQDRLALNPPRLRKVRSSPELYNIFQSLGAVDELKCDITPNSSRKIRPLFDQRANAAYRGPHSGSVQPDSQFSAQSLHSVKDQLADDDSGPLGTRAFSFDVNRKSTLDVPGKAKSTEEADQRTLDNYEAEGTVDEAMSARGVSDASSAFSCPHNVSSYHCGSGGSRTPFSRQHPTDTLSGAFPAATHPGDKSLTGTDEIWHSRTPIELDTRVPNLRRNYSFPGYARLSTEQAGRQGSGACSYAWRMIEHRGAALSSAKSDPDRISRTPRSSAASNLDDLLVAKKRTSHRRVQPRERVAEKVKARKLTPFVYGSASSSASLMSRFKKTSMGTRKSLSSVPEVETLPPPVELRDGSNLILDDADEQWEDSMSSQVRSAAPVPISIPLSADLLEDSRSTSRTPSATSRRRRESSSHSEAKGNSGGIRKVSSGTGKYEIVVNIDYGE